MAKDLYYCPVLLYVVRKIASTPHTAWLIGTSTNTHFCNDSDIKPQTQIRMDNNYNVYLVLYSRK